jgi:hypothetical protein
MELTSALIGIAQEAASATEEDSRAIAERGVRKIGPKQLRELAVLYVVNMIDYYRRAEARQVERAASLYVEQGSASIERESEAQRQTDEREAWLADPSILDWGRRTAETGVATVIMDSKQRKKWIKWLGDRYEDWYARGLDLSDHARAAGLYESAGRGEFFAADFWPDGCMAYRDMQRVKRVYELIDEVAEDVRLETTRELLDTFFALGDGTRTTWGSATIAEHEQRIELLARQSAGVIDTAASHRAAIDMIGEAGVTCLAEVPRDDPDGS